MGGQAKACPTTEEVSPLGGACFSLPIHTGVHHKFHEIRSSESRRGTQECVRHGLVCEVIFAPHLSTGTISVGELPIRSPKTADWPRLTDLCNGQCPDLRGPPPRACPGVPPRRHLPFGGPRPRRRIRQ